jgi:hypothetical protein
MNARANGTRLRGEPEPVQLSGQIAPNRCKIHEEVGTRYLVEGDDPLEIPERQRCLIRMKYGRERLETLVF